LTQLTNDVQRHILAVEDDAVIRTLIRAILGQAEDVAVKDATLHEAASLGEARRILASERIDLLLLDVHLPDGLGLDLATELRGDSADRPAIVALTASVLPAEQQAALDSGCDAFLAKPYPAAALISLCSKLLVQRSSAAVTRIQQGPQAG
jgi:CheY-like chemotaxis protein